MVNDWEVFYREVRLPPSSLITLSSQVITHLHAICPCPQEVEILRWGGEGGKAKKGKSKSKYEIWNYAILSMTSSSSPEHAEPSLLLLCSLFLGTKLRNSSWEKSLPRTDICESPSEKPPSPSDHLIQKLNG